MNKTKIPWTNYTSNPIRARRLDTGKRYHFCTKVSPECAHCYSEAINKRWGNRLEYNQANQHNVRFELDEMEFVYWVNHKNPEMIFICDMTDLFHELILDEMIYRVFKAMSLAPWHRFQVLTKRIDRAGEIYPKIRGMLPDRLNHVWMGVTAGTQKTFDSRVTALLRLHAPVSFVSMEPLLEDITIHPYALGQLSTCQIDQFIIGCESGAGRRHTPIDWIRHQRDQIIGHPHSRSKLFIKQMEINGRVVHMPALDGQVWDQRPEVTR